MTTGPAVLDWNHAALDWARARRRVLPLAGAAAVLTVAWRFLAFNGFNNDHYIHLAGAQQMLLGEWPVRDFVDSGMPLMYAVHATAQALFGSALGVEWGVVAAAFGIAAACTVMAASRLAGSLAIGVLVTVFEVAISPRSFGYPKVLLYAAAALAIIAAARRVTLGTLAVMAVLTAVAFLFRHDHGVFIAIGSLTVLIIGTRHDGWRRGVQCSAAFTALVVLWLLPWLVLVQTSEGLGEYFRAGIAFSRAEAIGNGLREIPRLHFDDIGSIRNALTWLFYLFHALPLAGAAMLALRRSAPDAWPGERAAVAAFVALSIPLNVTFLRGNLDGRVPDAVVPAALLGAWLLGLGVRRPLRFWPVVLSGILVSISAWAVVRVGEVGAQLEKTELLSGPHAVRVRAADLWDRLTRRVPERDHVPSRYAMALMPFMQYVGRCTAPQDRLLVTGLRPEINVIAGRGFAGGHSTFQPNFYTTDADQALTIARLERQAVPFVVSVQQIYPELTMQMPAVMAYIERRFEPFVHVPVPETTGVDLLIERHRPASRLDAQTGWPCFQ